MAMHVGVHTQRGLRPMAKTIFWGFNGLGPTREPMITTEIWYSISAWSGIFILRVAGAQDMQIAVAHAHMHGMNFFVGDQLLNSVATSDVPESHNTFSFYFIR